jgi:ABC-type transport system substrate-binding protein
MLIYWLRTAKVLLSAPSVLILFFILACGTAATPTATPTAPVESTTIEPSAPEAPANVVPTAEALPSPNPGGDTMAGPQHAPGFASYWKPPTDFYGQPVYGGTLRVIYEDPLEHGNVWGAYSGATLRMRAPTMNLIVMHDLYDSNASPLPSLAYGWTIHNDSQGVTFFLQEGIKWHNNTDFTCEDARFTFETIITGEGLTASYRQAIFSHVAEGWPRCLDDSTLEFRFTAPSPVPLEAISSPQVLVFNKEWFLAGGEEAMFQDISVGTGPFKWSPGQEVGVDTQRFERNPDYFIEELPYLDELIFIGIVEESAQQAAMLSHQVDWHWVRNWGQYEAYVDHEQIMTVIRPTRGAFTLFMNPRTPPFDNVKVRQAFTMAIDREVGIQIIQQGHGSPGFLYPPGAAWELDQEIGCAVLGWCQPANMEAQRAEAREILEQEGFDFNKTYIMTVESDQQVVARNTFLQEQLRLIGVKTDFDLVETTAYKQQHADGTWADLMGTNSGGGITADDPSVALGIAYRCDSVRNFWTPGTECDTKMEGLLDQVDSTLDPVERKSVTDEIQLYVMEEYMRFPIYWEQEAMAFWPEVRGYVAYPTASESFQQFSHMWIDPAHKDAKEFRGQTTGVPGGIQ